MGHSQSYDLRNPEPAVKGQDTVRGVRRVSKEHQTDTQYAVDGIETFDYREEELRDRIRREQLRKREEELESLRIRHHETREPIIDAYRQTSTQPASYSEFNYYDSLKHPHPVDPTTYFSLKPRREVNDGRMYPLPVRSMTVVPADPAPAPTRDYPGRSPMFSGRLSPLPRHPEVEPHPIPRYVPAMSVPRYEDVPIASERQGPLPTGTYSKTTMVSTSTTYKYAPRTPARYDEVPIVSHSGTSTYSKAAKVPRYDEVPVEVTHFIPISVVPKEPKHLEQVPLEMEVPLVPLDRHVVLREHPRYAPKEKEKEVTPVYRNVPVKISAAPAPAPLPVESLHKQPEVPRTPLDQYVRQEPVYRTPQNAAPVFRDVPVSSSPVEPPVEPPTPLHKQREVSRTPLGHYIQEEPVYRTPTPQSAATPPVYRTMTPTAVTPRHQEVRMTPLGNYIIPQHPESPTPTHTSEIHAEKPMIVGLEEPEPKNQHVTYVTVATDPEFPASPKPQTHQIILLERLHRQPEVGKHPVHSRPSQSSYEHQAPIRKQFVPSPSPAPPQTRFYINQETQYSRRPSEDLHARNILEPQKKCEVEHCTHVEVHGTPLIAKRRVSQDTWEKENRLTIFVNEPELENVIDLARDEDVGPVTSQSRRCFEEKLYYNGYMPTLSLSRRPIVSFYDKLH
ncbi:unnamed protein product [Caenorhabditis sp. 36 PRJEB53466]|nr:unnamed protein product [Caenorhabditis sp. 36 PRJEB53466]